MTPAETRLLHRATLAEAHALEPGAETTVPYNRACAVHNWAAYPTPAAQLARELGPGYRVHNDVYGNVHVTKVGA